MVQKRGVKFWQSDRRMPAFVLSFSFNWRIVIGIIGGLQSSHIKETAQWQNQ